MNLPSCVPTCNCPRRRGTGRFTALDPGRSGARSVFQTRRGGDALLRHWSLGDPEQVLRAANREPGLPLDGASGAADISARA
jgi:putative peptide zinc metalloprotease protein